MFGDSSSRHLVAPHAPRRSGADSRASKVSSACRTPSRWTTTQPKPAVGNCTSKTSGRSPYVCDLLGQRLPQPERPGATAFAEVHAMPTSGSRRLTGVLSDADPNSVSAEGLTDGEGDDE